MAKLTCILSILALVLALLAGLHHVECRYNLQDHGAVLAGGSSGRTEESQQQGMNHPPSRTFDDPAEGANYFLPPPRLPPAHLDAGQATPSYSDAVSKAMADSRFLQGTSQEQEQEQEEDQDPPSTASESKPSSKAGYHAHTIGINRRPPPPGSNSPHT